MDPFTAAFVALFAKVPWLLPGAIAAFLVLPAAVRAAGKECTPWGHFIVAFTSDVWGALRGRRPDATAPPEVKP